MIETLGHHLIPLLSLPGTAKGTGDKAYMATVKANCKSAERIHGVLTLAGRFEMAVIPEVPDFFAPTSTITKARNLIWETIRTTPRLQWLIPTRHPEHISRQLPPTWIGKGFHNACIALLADHNDGLTDRFEALRTTPLQHRAIIIPTSSPSINLSDHLHGMDWVVLMGNEDAADMDSTVESVCRDAGVPFLFLNHDVASGIPSDNSLKLPQHPFGSKIDLSRPTLPDLKRTMPWARMDKPPLPAIPTPTAAADAERLDFEVLTQDIAPGTSTIEAPSPILADHPDEAEFARLDGVVRRGLTTFIEVGNALAEIRLRELWLAGGHTSWAAYCQSVGGFSKTHANRLINSAEIAIRIAEAAPIGATPTSESQIRPLCKLKQPEQQIRAWKFATERAEGQPSARVISDVVAELMAVKAPKPQPSISRNSKIAHLLRLLRSEAKGNRSAKVMESLITRLEKCLSIKATEEASS